VQLPDFRLFDEFDELMRGHSEGMPLINYGHQSVAGRAAHYNPEAAT